MNYHLKSLIRRTMLALPGGERLYRWLTAGLLGTNAGMAYKWFRVMPGHVRVLREQFGEAARRQRLWCFDSGATMAAGLAMAVVSDVPGLLTDRHDRLAERYCAISRRVLGEKGEELAAISGSPEDRVARVLARTEGLGARQALREVLMSYAPEHAAAEGMDWYGQVGCIFSAGTLEHYMPEALEAEVARMALALRSGGVMSHVVDHRDHRWHADKRLHPLAHLTLDDEDYAQRFANPLEYHNRWLLNRYVELFTRYGFQVTARTAIACTPDLPPLDRNELASPFREATEEELNSLVTHFVAVKS